MCFYKYKYTTEVDKTYIVLIPLYKIGTKKTGPNLNLVCFSSYFSQGPLMAGELSRVERGGIGGGGVCPNFSRGTL